MTAVAASLILYLLFPTVNAEQEKFEALLVKTPLTESEKFVKRQELLSFLTTPHFSGAQDADELSFLPQEQTVFTTGDEKLSLLKNGEEELSLMMLPSHEKETVSVNSSQIVRRVYDGRYRLSSVTVWKNSKNASQVYLEKTENYFYSDTEDDALQKKETVYYDAKQSPSLTHTVYYDSKKNAVREVKAEDSVTISEITRAFDADDRLVREEEKSFGEKNADTYVYEYTYTQFDEPDYSYYENSVLRISRVYQGKGSYTQTVFFDGGFSVVSVYEDFIKTEEHFIEGRK